MFFFCCNHGGTVCVQPRMDGWWHVCVYVCTCLYAFRCMCAFIRSCCTCGCFCFPKTIAYNIMKAVNVVCCSFVRYAVHTHSHTPSTSIVSVLVWYLLVVIECEAYALVRVLVCMQEWDDWRRRSYRHHTLAVYTPLVWSIIHSMNIHKTSTVIQQRNWQ